MYKMNALIMIISCIVTIFFLSSCTEASRYSGDGKLVDNGPLGLLAIPNG